MCKEKVSGEEGMKDDETHTEISEGCEEMLVLIFFVCVNMI